MIKSFFRCKCGMEWVCSWEAHLDQCEECGEEVIPFKITRTTEVEPPPAPTIQEK